MVVSLKHQALAAVPVPHPAVDRLNLTWNDLRICFYLRKMNTQLFQKYFNHIRYWNWEWISEHVELDESFIYLYCRHVDWVKISRHQHLTVDLVTQFETEISWVDLSANPHLTIDIITRFASRLDWGLVCKTIVLDEPQIRQFQRYVDWYEISRKSPLSGPFIEEHCDRVHWARITAHQRLTDDFIDRNRDRVDWDYISRHWPMDRTFIEDHADYVDWGLISDGQELSEQFILDHRDHLDWEEIAYGQPISEEFFEEHAPKTPAVWAAFTAGRVLSPGFIRDNITHLPARELTQYQQFTLDEIAIYADHLDWIYLSSVHTFTRPGSDEIDEQFVRTHAARIKWPQFVQAHVLSVELLLEFRDKFEAHDIQQEIPLGELERHPELANREWISRNCPLTVEFLRAASHLIVWTDIILRHLPEDVVRAFSGELNLSMIPTYQPPLSPEWITEQARTARQWAFLRDVDPRYWPLYANRTNITHIECISDEFFRRNRDLALATRELLSTTETHILLSTMVSVAYLCPPVRAARIRFKCALNEIDVPSTWDYLERTATIKWPWLVRTRRLSEAFLRRFQHKVDWKTLCLYQPRPFSERFIREFNTRLDLHNLPLPYDVTVDYVRDFGARHDWAMVTRDLPEWQMEQFLEYCNFTVPPNKTLSEAFITRHYAFKTVAVTQPLSEAFIRKYPRAKLPRNNKLVLSQRFLHQNPHTSADLFWVRVSNQTLATIPDTGYTAAAMNRAETSVYVRSKLLTYHGVEPTSNDPINLATIAVWNFWTQQTIPESILRRFVRTISWTGVSTMQSLSDDFLYDFRDKIAWKAVSRRPGLSESTIRRFKDYVHWPEICGRQRLTEDFIAEFADRVSWESVSPYSACF